MPFDINAAMSAVGLLGKLFGGGSKQQATDRQNKDVVNAQRDRNQLSAISDREQALIARAALELKQREFDAAQREAAYKQNLRSQYLQGWSPAQRPDGIQMIRGGFNTIPSRSVDTAREMERQATLKLLNGEKFAPLPAMQQFVQSPLAPQSTWEKLSGILGLGLTAAPSIYDVFKGERNNTPYVGDAIRPKDDERDA